LGAIFEPVFDPILSPQKYFGTPGAPMVRQSCRTEMAFFNWGQHFGTHGAPMVRQFVVHIFGSFFTRFFDQI
jgi:hypothetical protein